MFALAGTALALAPAFDLGSEYYQEKSRISTALEGKLTPEMSKQEMRTPKASGGQRRRLAECRPLVAAPNALGTRTAVGSTPAVGRSARREVSWPGVGPDIHSRDSDIHFADSDTHSLNSDIHKENTDTHFTSTDTHNRFTYTHTESTDIHADNSDTHRVNSDLHYDDSDLHMTDSDTHSVNTDTHAEDSDTHLDNSDTHTSESDTHDVTNSDTHYENTDVHTWTTSHHTTNSDTHTGTSNSHLIDSSSTTGDQGGEECEVEGQANQGDAYVNGAANAFIGSFSSDECKATFTIDHRIVTYDTPRGRDLYGRLRLTVESGDPDVVTLLVNGLPYTIGSAIQVVEAGHLGCGVHTWHDGSELFEVYPMKGGTVTLRVEVDPDPEPEGDGPPRRTAQITIQVPDFGEHEIAYKTFIQCQAVVNPSPFPLCCDYFDGNNRWLSYSQGMAFGRGISEASPRRGPWLPWIRTRLRSSRSTRNLARRRAT